MTEQELRHARLRLAGYSFLILFFELAFIRYFAGYVRIFGFYLNFVLIATFLGMGVGLLRQESAARLRWLAVPVTVLLFVMVKYYSNIVVEAPLDRDEYIWGVFFEIDSSARRVAVLPVITILFTLSSLFFVPLGALMGREFRKFAPLEAYTTDIGGSLLGILAFSALSALRTPPAVWMTIGFAIWLLLSLTERKFAVGIATTGVAAVAMSLMTVQGGSEVWSPYYRLNLHSTSHWVTLHVNGSMHQWMVDLNPDTGDADSLAIRALRDAYLLPFQAVRRVDTALVVGAGTGNDVALLLELGARHVDAVEIDPVILDIGRAEHVQQPYSDPRVTFHVNDARAFLKRTDRRYDVIVFATLDSQTLLSGMSSLRLDNYMYTEESFAEARRHLKDDGTLITYHLSPVPYVAAKIYGVIAAAFGEPPTVIFAEPGLFNYTFVAGDQTTELSGDPLPEQFSQPVALPRDNWPYLYLRRATIPTHYVAALFMVMAVGLVLISGAGAARKLSVGFDWPMFFMGMGFLLLETKSVSEMSLLFGSTWTVNVFVFSSILVFILGANVWVSKRAPRSLTAVFGGIFAALAIAFFVPIRLLLPLGIVGEWVIGGLIVALPMLFAAMAFAMMFRERKNSTDALAANLLGAIVGGVLEYSSLVIGFKGLYVLAAAAYLAAFVKTRWAFSLLPLLEPESERAG